MSGTATSTDFPYSDGDTIHSLFKFQPGWIIGIGYNTTKTSPIVDLYKISNVAPLMVLKTRYQVTQASGGSVASFWNPQSLLISPKTNSIVFSLLNYNPTPNALMV